MRKVIYAINATADGFFGHENGIADDELHDFFADLLKNADLLVYGRITYQLMVPYWPEIAKSGSETESVNRFARAFDSVDKLVFSRTLSQSGDARSKIAEGDLISEITRLKEQPGKDICVGSLSIASRLSAFGLIDEYYFVIHPVIAGHGPRMFEAVKQKDALLLRLDGIKTFGSGAVALHYVRPDAIPVT